VPAFEGSFRCTVEIEEWKALVRGLRELESSVGRDAQFAWTNMEDNIELKISLEQEL
jgi:hypothetical protein